MKRKKMNALIQIGAALVRYIENIGKTGLTNTSRTVRHSLLHNNVCQTHHRKIMQMKSISQEGKFFNAQICWSLPESGNPVREFIAPLKVFFLPRLLSG